MPASVSASFTGSQRFRLERLLGRGATGAVYAAFDREQGRRSALKLLTSWHPLTIERFKNEFRALQDVRHANLVELRELLFIDQQWVLAMELVDGTDFMSYVLRRAPSSEPSFSDASPSAVTLLPLDAPRVECSPPIVVQNLDHDRLCDALAQLVRGLAALHAAGKVHRDVKPSNVLVDAGGRVVIVDFGLVAQLADSEGALQTPLLGTPRYMSPEQAAGRDVGPKSDLYSVGAMLYEALTGSAPLRDTELVPQPPRAPTELWQLCVALLGPRPEERPDVERILASCRRSDAPQPSQITRLGAGGDTTFVGRAAELGELERAWLRVRRGAGVTVVIEADSGVGKTALMRHFAEQSGARCLQGRCFEHESLPYKAIDGLMDALGDYLSQHPRDLPASAGLVGQIFPVLRRLPGFMPTTPVELVDPQRQRLRLFAALRELLTSLSQTEPLLLMLDDMQWSDADSMALLSALLEPPAPPLLLIAAQRPGGPLGRNAFLGQALHIALGNLSEAEAELLAATLLPADAPAADARMLAQLTHESQGHPLFLRELARQVGHAGVTELRLDDALWRRVEALPADTRRLVQLAAVAGRPLERRIVFQALGELEPLGAGDFEQQLSDLRHSSLLRSSGARASDTIETYHDRVREAVLARLEPETQRRQHLSVARVLERSGSSDAEALATHFRAGGESARAFTYAARAAEQAEAAFAFDRAAHWYGSLLELGNPEPSERRELLAKQASALANAGRGFEAAETFQRAAEGDDSLTGLLRQRLSGEQLLRSGHIASGVEAVSKVLSRLGLRVPKTNAAALLSLLWSRARLAIRGFDYAERAPGHVAPLELSRIDGLWTAATCLTMFDNTRSAELQCRGILRALDNGTSLQVLRAHTAESIFLATAGDSKRADIDRVLARARELAERLADPYAFGWIGLSHGATAFLLGDWQRGEEQCRDAERIFRDRAGAQWELGSARAFGTWSAMMRGSFGRVAVDVPAYVDEAEKRGDLYAATMQMTGFSNVAWLCQNDVAQARHRLSLAQRRWPGARFDVPRYLNMLAAATIELYSGNGRAAYATMLRDWRSLRWGIAFRAQITRFGMRTTRGLAALAAYDEAREPGLLVDAERCARAIFAERVTWSSCFAGIIAAGAQLRRGHVEAAIAELELAEQRAESTGMALHRALLRSRRGQLVGGELGRELRSHASAFMQREGIADGEAMADMLTPRLPSRR